MAPRTVRALVVDDCSIDRRVITRSLSATGLATFEFTEATDGFEALEKYDPAGTDLVFVDLNMPRMSGVELLRRIRSSHGRCPPAVLITSESDSNVLTDAMNESRVDAVLLKPVDPQRLMKGLATIVARLPDRAAGWTIPHGDCVAQAMRETVAEVCKMAVSVDPSRVLAPRIPNPEPETVEGRNVVFGVITLGGDLQWSVTLGFEQNAAEGIASRLAGCPISSDSADLGDAIGEITNIVAGRLKHLLIRKTVSVTHSLPTVFSADRIRLLVQRGHATCRDRIDFNSEVGRFWIAVTTGSNTGVFL